MSCAWASRPPRSPRSPPRPSMSGRPGTDAPACSPETISGLSAGPSVASLTAPAYETAERSWCTDRADLGLVDQLGAGEGLGQPLDTGADVGRRSEERRVGKEGVRTCRSGGSPVN